MIIIISYSNAWYPLLLASEQNKMASRFGTITEEFSFSCKQGL